MIGCVHQSLAPDISAHRFDHQSRITGPSDEMKFGCLSQVTWLDIL